MAKRNRSFKKRKVNISLAIIAGLIPTVMEGKRYWDATYPKTLPDQILNAGKGITAALTGYDADSKSWALTRAVGILPIGLGVLVHSLANRFGLNRMIAKTGIPFLRI